MGAPDDEVRHAYRRLVKQAHPDAAGDPARFQRITEAYDVLSDRARRAAYDRSLRPEGLPSRGPRRRRRYGRWVAALIVAGLAGGVAYLVIAGASEWVGDDCLVGTWTGETFAVPFRAVLDGREVVAEISGGAGVELGVSHDGTVRTDYANAAPLTGATGSDRVVGRYTGRTIERWQAADGQIQQRGTDASQLRFEATINGRRPDQPLQPTVVDRDYPYTCSPSALEVGPYRYSPG